MSRFAYINFGFFAYAGTLDIGSKTSNSSTNRYGSLYTILQLSIFSYAHMSYTVRRISNGGSMPRRGKHTVIYIIQNLNNFTKYIDLYLLFVKWVLLLSVWRNWIFWKKSVVNLL